MIVGGSVVFVEDMKKDVLEKLIWKIGRRKVVQPGLPSDNDGRSPTSLWTSAALSAT